MGCATPRQVTQVPIEDYLYYPASAICCVLSLHSRLVLLPYGGGKWVSFDIFIGPGLADNAPTVESDYTILLI